MDITRTARDRPSPAPSRPAPGLARRVVRAVLDLALPAACLACGRAGEGSGHLGLCPTCRGRMRRPAPGCAVCGETVPAAASGAAPPPGGWTCGRCRRRPPPFSRLVAPWSYEGPLLSVIGGLKYRRLEYLGAHLAREIADALASSGAATGAEGHRRFDAVVPVPLHWRRRWRRGYNQAERIARPLGGLLSSPCVDALRRRRATRPQTGLAREDRLDNPRGAFVARRRAVHAEARALLVDDVATTGATLAAAARALLEGGYGEVVAVAAARTPEGAPDGGVAGPRHLRPAW